MKASTIYKHLNVPDSLLRKQYLRQRIHAGTVLGSALRGNYKTLEKTGSNRWRSWVLVAQQRIPLYGGQPNCQPLECIYLHKTSHILSTSCWSLINGISLIN